MSLPESIVVVLPDGRFRVSTYAHTGDNVVSGQVTVTSGQMVDRGWSLGIEVAPGVFALVVDQHTRVEWKRRRVVELVASGVEERSAWERADVEWRRRLATVSSTD